MVSICAALAGAACSSDAGSSGSGRGSGGSSGTVPGGTTSASQLPGSKGSSNSTGGFGNSTTNPSANNNVVRNPGAISGTDTVNASFIWIANSAEGTVSKLDTRTMMELGRYLTTQNGKGLPSRTSVGKDGAVAVANRGNATGWQGGDGGGVIKIWSSQSQCQDKNGNGMIDTSTGAMDVKPWGQDECVAWFTPINEFSNRPVQWAPAPGPDVPANIWTAGATMCTAMNCSLNVYRLDGTTGMIRDTVAITGLMGVDMLTAGGGIVNAGGDPMLNMLINGFIPSGGFIDNYGPYGGASDAGGNFWVFVANTTQLLRIDAVTLQWQQWPIPMGNGYGITIDPKGRIFICGTLGLSRFDPGTATWINNNTDTDLGYNGCMTDGKDKIWVGGGSDQGNTGLFGFDAETLKLVDQVNQDAMNRPMNVKGVSIDIDGKVWGVSSPGAMRTGNGNSAWRFDPVTREVAAYDGLNGAYSYSDMTGFGLQHAGFQTPKVQ
ncbi:MAG: hypothetical protein ACHQ53_09960 [Polyangiales bacterium]